MVRRPDSMRVTLLGPAGIAWFVGTVNRRVVAYAAPEKRLYKKIPSTKNAILRIGRINLYPYDLIRFIHPGLEPAWLEDAIKTGRENRLLVRKKDASYKLTLDENSRVASITVVRDGGGPVMYVYSYPAEGRNGFSVEIDGKIRFDFVRVETGRHMADDLFEPPIFR